MNELGPLLLEGISVGDYVSVVYGVSAGLFSSEGYVEYADNQLLILRHKNGRNQFRVLVRLLMSLELKDPTDAPIPELAPVEERPVGSQPEADNTAPVSQTEPVEKRPNQSIPPLPAPQQYQLDSETLASELRGIIKSLSNKTIKNTLNAVLDSLRDAEKTNSLKDKYQSLRAKTLTLWEECSEPDEYYAFYFQLGLLALCAGDPIHAVEPLVRSHHYRLAAYAASLAHHEDYQEILTLCALLSGEDGTALDQYVADICLKRQDIQPLFVLLEQHKQDPDYVGALLSCAWEIYQRSGCAANLRLAPEDAPQNSAARLLNALPSRWRMESKILKKWNTYDHYTYPASHAQDAQDDWITGTILDYKLDRRFGFIHVDGSSNNYYFYIRQVANEEPIDLLLRNLLAMGKAKGLEVSFSLGESPVKPGQSSANDIYLTQKGYDAAVARLSAESGLTEDTGSIAEAPNDAGFGRLYSGGKQCNYLLDSVVDPFLHAYLSGHFGDSFQEQEVFFQTEYRNGKPTAQRIRWKDPSPTDLEPLRSLISPDSTSLWEEYRASLEAAKASDAPLELPDKEDPYPSYPFELLPDWKPASDKLTIRPLTWKISAISSDTPEGKRLRPEGASSAIQTAPSEQPSAPQDAAPSSPSKEA